MLEGTREKFRGTLGRCRGREDLKGTNWLEREGQEEGKQPKKPIREVREDRV